MAGFRWSFLTARDGSPFECKSCTYADRGARNCFNRLSLDEKARAVERYTEDVTRELKDKGARKVFSLGELRLYECPLSYISRDTHEIMRAVFLSAEGGRLLFSGGWAEQAYWFVEAIEIFKIERERFLREKDGR